MRIWQWAQVITVGAFRRCMLDRSNWMTSYYSDRSCQCLIRAQLPSIKEKQRKLLPNFICISHSLLHCPEQTYLANSQTSQRRNIKRHRRKIKDKRKARPNIQQKRIKHSRTSKEYKGKVVELADPIIHRWKFNLRPIYQWIRQGGYRRGLDRDGFALWGQIVSKQKHKEDR